jgi:hypothetical protein
MALGVLALGGLWTVLIGLFVLGFFVIGGYALWQFRSDDFWDEHAND